MAVDPGYEVARTSPSLRCAYGLLQSRAPRIQDMGPLDTASYYFNLRKVFNAPTLIRVTLKDKAQGGKLVDRWVLHGKVVFFPPGTTLPPLSYDDETRDYLSTWVPIDILQTDAFKDVPFVKGYWPRGERPTGIVLHAIRMPNKEYRESHQKAQQAWLEECKSRGEDDAKLPPAFHFVRAI
ncbi:hypothetical protein C8T65DRAFT_734960 [Cerioporus squamosus]|nr:hypothetical protein C8T65DRAFT_734960 [Cerioporus squamosus]